MRVNFVGSHKVLQIGTVLASTGDPTLGFHWLLTEPSMGPHWLLADPVICPAVAIANIVEGSLHCYHYHSRYL